ncbi:MAG TPA: sensor histidine kinase [Egibacteraceae bacterium]|nr:sensor histidine kinase [Egibacteraceae bacterium]
MSGPPEPASTPDPDSTRSRRRGADARPRRDWRLPVPDNVLLRRFGYVRLVGFGAWLLACIVLYGIFGTQMWPIALGLPVLAVVTGGYFARSTRYPRTAVVVSLLADALVLGGAIAFLGGSGSGLVMLYAIVVVSAGILLGPGAATVFGLLTVFLGVLQLVIEEMGFPPVLLHRPELDDRLPILLASLAGLVSVGYLSTTYAGRLHELLALADEEAEQVRERGRRRRSFVRQASIDVREPLLEVERVADELDERWADMTESERRRMAARLRMRVTELDAEIGQLEDLGAMDETGEQRLVPVLLPRAVADVVVALGERLDGYVIDIQVPQIKVLGSRRGARRVIYNLMENVIQHTPLGTGLRVTGLTTAGHGVLVFTDDGPGIPSNVAHRLFDAPDEGGGPRVGLPLVAELCAAMGADIRYEPAPSGGSRFMVAFRLAPSGAPSADDEAPADAAVSGPAAAD